MTMRTQSPDTSPEAERVMIELLRRAPIWRRLQLAESMSRTTRLLTMSGIRQRFPQADEDELRRRFAELYLGPELAVKAFGPLPS